MRGYERGMQGAVKGQCSVARGCGAGHCLMGGGGFRGSQGQLQWRLQVTHKAVGGSYWRLERWLQAVGGQAKA